MSLLDPPASVVTANGSRLVIPATALASGMMLKIVAGVPTWAYVPGTEPPPALVSDNFDRADGALAGSAAATGQTWALLGGSTGYSITGNKVGGPANSPQIQPRIAVPIGTPSGPVTVKADILYPAGTTYLGIFLGSATGIAYSVTPQRGVALGGLTIDLKHTADGSDSGGPKETLSAALPASFVLGAANHYSLTINPATSKITLVVDGAVLYDAIPVSLAASGAWVAGIISYSTGYIGAMTVDNFEVTVA